MSDRIAGELHRLYRDYYASRLALADYRYQRGMLLDSLLDHGPDADEQHTMPREEAAELRPVQKSSAPVREPQSKGFRWPYVVAVCVPLLALVVFFVTRQLEQPLPSEPVAQSTVAVVEETVEVSEPQKALEPDIERAPDVGQILAEDFVRRDDWSEPSLREFQDTWRRLPAGDRIVAKGSMWFAPLVDGLDYQIDEAAEFSSDPDNDARLASLYQFASTLGLPEMTPSGWRPQEPKPVIHDTPETATGTLIDTSGSEATAGEAESGLPVKAPPQENEFSCRASQLKTRRRSCQDLLANGSNGPRMRVVAAGSLGDGRGIEVPFAISLSEISRQEFEEYCRDAGVTCPDDPWPGEAMPVVNVSWNEAAAYCVWLSERTGYLYRLPSETEWEYAARAGSVAEYPFGEELTPAMARYSGLANYDRPLSTNDTTTRRNEFGLWHVVGNVREWVAPDGVFNGDERTARGGSYADSEDGLRLTVRKVLAASDRDMLTGFRILREL
jgi:hypothetical protein